MSILILALMGPFPLLPAGLHAGGDDVGDRAGRKACRGIEGIGLALGARQGAVILEAVRLAVLRIDDESVKAPHRLCNLRTLVDMLVIPDQVVHDSRAASPVPAVLTLF